MCLGVPLYGCMGMGQNLRPSELHILVGFSIILYYRTIPLGGTVPNFDASMPVHFPYIVLAVGK